MFIYGTIYVHGFLSMKTHPGWEWKHRVSQRSSSLDLPGGWYRDPRCGTWWWSMVVKCHRRLHWGFTWMPWMAQQKSRTCCDVHVSGFALCSSSMSRERYWTTAVFRWTMSTLEAESLPASTSHGRMSPLLSHPGCQKKKIRASQATPNTRHQDTSIQETKQIH